MFTQFQNYVQRNIGTTAVTVVTCPAAQQLVINQLSCANRSNLPVTCTVTIIRASVTVAVVNEAVVPAGGALACAGFDQKLVIMAGDVIQVRSNTANSIDCVISGVLNDFGGAVAVPAPPTSPAATFSITPSALVIGESQGVTFNVATTNVPNGTVLYWENFGTLSQEDFTDGLNQGEFVINGNAGSFTRTLKATGQLSDPFSEGQELIQMAVQFRPGFLGGNPVTATTVTVVPDSISTLGLILNLDAGDTNSYSGGSTWVDLSGNGNNGTASATTYSTVNGGALAFTEAAASTAITTLPLTSIPALSGWTLECWMRPTAFPTGGATKKNGVLLGAAYYSGAAIYWNGNTAGTAMSIYGYIRGNDAYRVTASVSLALNTWYHLLVVADPVAVQLRLYVIGVLFSTVAGATQQYNSANASIAGNIGINRNQVDGGGAETYSFSSSLISVARVYNRALSPTEVIQNYTATRSRFLGYQSIVYTATANVTLTNNGSSAVTMFKNADNGVWNGEVRSTDSFTAPCTIEFSKQAAATDNGVSYAMIGWNEDPTANTSYTTLDYASYPYTSNTYSVYHNGTQVLFSGAWDPTKRFYVVYDTDGFIRHYNGSTLLYSVNYGVGKTVFVDSAFYSVNATTGGFTNVQVSRSSWNGAGYT